MFDHKIFDLIKAEEQRQQETINLIASENYASHEVRAATASVLTNKYAEGYPSKRYYAGCEIVDVVESIAIERCKELFGAEHANVQPHAGSQANLAAYMALLKPGDTILGMSLAEGGHLTHGHAVNISGMFYHAVQYTVHKQTELLDYAEIRAIAHKTKPKLIIAGASAYSRTIDFAQFAHIAQEVGAYLLADIAHIAGMVAVGLHPTPIGYADVVTSTTHKTLRGPRGGLIMSTYEHAQTIDRAIMPGMQGGPFMNVIAAKAVALYEALSPQFKTYQQQVITNAQTMVEAFKEREYRIVADGTDNHLFVIDLRNKNITGRTAEYTLQHAGITISRSCIPFDPEKPWITSGIRIGTPAVTTRGMKEKDMHEIVDLIDQVIMHHNNAHIIEKIKNHVKELCKKFNTA